MPAQARTLAMVACLLVGAACDEADEGGTGPRPAPVEPVVTVEPATVNLDVGGTAQLIGRVGGSRGIINPTLSWSSSNPEVATVSLTGMVIARGEGFAIITAASGKNSAFARVNVSAVSQAQDQELARRKRRMQPF